MKKWCPTNIRSEALSSIVQHMFAMMKHAFLVVVVLLAWEVKAAPKKLPSYVKICKRNDPNLSQCWKDSMESLRPYLIKGIPEFGTPPIEPFLIKKLVLNQGNSSNIQFIADMKDCVLSGGGDFVVVDVNADFDKAFLNIIVKFPHMELHGEYKSKGRVLLFQFDSDGKIEGKFDNIVANATYYMETVKKNGQDYLHVKNDTMDVKASKMYLYIHNLFRNNEEVTKSVNDAINENIDILYEDFRPLLSTTVRQVLIQYVNRVFAMYPMDVLLPSD